METKRKRIWVVEIMNASTKPKTVPSKKKYNRKEKHRKVLDN